MPGSLCKTPLLRVNELNLADNHLSTLSSKYIAKIIVNKSIKALYIQGNYLQDGEYLQILAH